MPVFLNEDISAEMKKDYLRVYFNKTGIIEKLTDIFNKMLKAEMKPENPLNFIREELGDKPIPAETLESMELELDDTSREIRRLRNILKKLGIDYTDERLDITGPGPAGFNGAEFPSAAPSPSLETIVEATPQES